MSRMIVACYPRNRNLVTEFPDMTALKRVTNGEGGWAEVQFANGIHGLWDTNDAELFMSHLPLTGLRGWTGENLMQAIPHRVRVWLLDVRRYGSQTGFITDPD